MKISIGFKISFTIMLVLIVEALIALTWVRNSTQNALKNIINEEFSQTINVIENEFSFLQQSNIYMANSFILDNKDLRHIQLETNRKKLHVDSLILIDANASIISQAGLFTIEAQNLQTYHIVHEVMKEKHPMSAIERVGDIFVFYTATPIFKGKKIIAEVLIGLQISNRVLKEMNKGSSIELAIVGDRVIGASSLTLQNGQPFVELPADYIEYLMLLNGKIDLLVTKINKKEYFIKAKNLKFVDNDTTNASLMLLYDTKNYKQQLAAMKNIQFWLILVMIFSVFATVMILSLYLKKNFKKLIVGLQKVAKGKYGQRVEIKTNDELEILSEYFNKMSFSLKEKENKIQEHVVELENKIKSISELKEEGKTLYKKATYDSLTGLYNRDKFTTMFGYMASTGKRENKKLVLAIADIDFFKSINDTYGHLVGDSVLRELATILQNNTRESDLVARWGGEEFVIAMLVNDANEARNVLEKLRSVIEHHKFAGLIAVTCSFGFSVQGYEEENKIVFERADDALYKAKSNGRNRVEVKL